MKRVDKGRPSGNNKEEGRGVPSPEKLQEEQTSNENFTDDEGNPTDQVREMNPNRNTDKEDATNAGGYKN